MILILLNGQIEQNIDEFELNKIESNDRIIFFG